MTDITQSKIEEINILCVLRNNFYKLKVLSTIMCNIRIAIGAIERSPDKAEVRGSSPLWPTITF